MPLGTQLAFKPNVTSNEWISLLWALLCMKQILDCLNSICSPFQHVLFVLLTSSTKGIGGMCIVSSLFGPISIPTCEKLFIV